MFDPIRRRRWNGTKHEGYQLIGLVNCSLINSPVALQYNTNYKYLISVEVLKKNSDKFTYSYSGKFQIK